MLLRLLPYVAVLIFSPDYVFLQSISRNKRANDYIPCEYGWFRFREKCYKVGGAPRKLNWHGAKDHCASLGGNLATIESKEENDFLVGLVLLEIKDSAWIGLHDIGNESDYKWVSGSTSDYRNWREDEPSGAKSENEDCVELLVWLIKDYVGVWNDMNCDHVIGYICEKKINPDQRSPNLRYCPSSDGGGFRLLDSCYHLVTTQKTWDEAEQHCIETFDSHLVTIIDKSIDYFLQYLLQSILAEVWIGIKTRDQLQQKWTSGWFVAYNGFDKEARDFIKGTCVVRKSRKKWDIVSCSQKYSFICEKSKVKAPVLKPPVKGSFCPTFPHGWRDMDGELCYFIETENPVSWYEANFECMRKGGNLISIHSKAEGDILHPFIQYNSVAAFIGLFRLYGQENTFGWTDGSPLDYVDWSPWEPNNENEKCAESREADMQWNDIQCTDKRAYICTMMKITPNTTSHTAENPESADLCSCTGYVKALIGVSVCFVLLVIVLGAVIYNFRPKFQDRKQNASVVSLEPRTQPCAVPRLKFMSSAIRTNEQDSSYEIMDS